jgi:hypothetical protein
MAAGPERRVRRRRVFYIPGYDPFPPRRYREIYRREGAAQAAISGHSLALLPRGGTGGRGWRVEARVEGEAVRSDFEVLVWSDIVRASMGAGIATTYLALARAIWTYLRPGSLWGLWRLRKGPVIATVYPVLVLLAQLLVALALAGVAVGALALVLPPPLPWLALAVAWPVLARFKRWDNRFHAHYLARVYAFSSRWGGAYSPALETRIAAFARRVAEALGDDVDEVLVVGHSLGVHIAVSVLADLIRANRVPPAGTALGFLSLGQVVPMLSFLPGADRLRADLACLATCDHLAWVDVSAPGDGCAFALCDPVAVSGVAPPGQRWPLVISAAFSQTLRPETWTRLRWHFYRLHFQYLHAFDNAGPEDYDYFRITAGPRTLASRYAGRAPSNSRIVRARSPFTSQAP